MTLLANRQVRVVVGNLDVSNLRIVFQVDKTTKPEPNTATVKVYQLSDTSRAELESAKSIPCSISAGYVDNYSEIFKGTLTSAWSEISGTEIVTTITSSEGGDEFRKSRISRSYGKGTLLSDIIGDVAATLGDASQLRPLLLGAKSRLTNSSSIPRAMVLSGSSARELTHLCKTAGFDWSIQAGSVQLTPRGQPVQGGMVSLTPGTGLLGSPSVDSKGVLTAQALLMPDLVPGKSVNIESRFISGNFRIETTSFEGDTYGDSWFTSIEGSRL